jgi:hypothetical protein
LSPCGPSARQAIIVSNSKILNVNDNRIRGRER